MSPTDVNLPQALTQATQLAKLRIAQRCQSDLFFLCKYVLGYSLMTDNTHGELCAYAESIIRTAPTDPHRPPNSYLPDGTQRDVVSHSTDTPTKNFSSGLEKTGELDVHTQKEGAPIESHLSQPAIPGTETELDVQEPPSDEVQRISDRVYDKHDTRLNQMLLLMPRGTFKSSVVTIGLSLQKILNDADVRILIDSETFAKAKAFLAEIKGHLEGNEAFREVYYTLYSSYPDSKKRDQLWRTLS
jgi:hypothetical protein